MIKMYNREWRELSSPFTPSVNDWLLMTTPIGVIWMNNDVGEVTLIDIDNRVYVSDI